jgi:polyisoprenoid-binding protein YceI
MKHPLHAWEGVSHDVNCAALYNDDTRQLENVAVAVKLSTFDSKDANRDSHGLEIMEAIKFPTVTFSSQSIKTNADGSLTATGKLTYHGITKPVTIQATRRDEAGKLILRGSFTYNLTDFNLERPSLLGVKTEDEVKMTFVVSFKI